MNRKLYSTTGYRIESINSKLNFYIETIELSRLSSFAFFEAGENSYKGERFYFQNAEKTQTLVGIGHAYVIESDAEEDRFDDIDRKWKALCATIVKEGPETQPVLFGGFSFDPKNKIQSEWNNFPSAYFVVPTFQLIMRDDRVFVSINYITEEEYSAQDFERLRIERDRLIHAAQVNELNVYAKPRVTSMEEVAKDLYLNAVKTVPELIRENVASKVVIARALKLSFVQSLTSSSVLHHLSLEQPESIHFGLELGHQFFFGATPERLVKVEQGRALSTCLAGSIKRGKTAEEDRLLGEELLNDAKNLGEHQFVVDMISSVFKEHCENNHIPQAPKLLKIRDIQHLYTPVEGTVKDDSTLLQLVKSLHPTPALGGEPKEQAMEIIRQYEQMNRGYYAAPIGWIDADGNGEFAVAIRSALLNKNDNTAYLYAGGGIVADSEVVSEYEETLVKFRPMIRALGGQLNG